ncbi:low molecular weight protein-tyrosine-phosphatase [Nocardioides yefusunii]|uniref:protein-tyrosine-phosphatase n=1 Tax=Nocardioides yefusunii TaxID=2500546 RepID=A0ABW1QUB3_9ACTN|nr:low molecular weight protein-tyrosine-phosphatase [Nocardioides yefusunii]
MSGRTTEPRTSVPAPRTPGRYRVAAVCLGNICRSPVADVVLSARVAEAGLADVVEVVSAGTAGYHVGGGMDPRSAATLSAAGYDPTRHRAQQFWPTWHDECDLVLVMDRSNLRDVGPGERTFLFRDFDPVGTGCEVPDPYYGGEDGFREVLEMVERTSERVVALIAAQMTDADTVGSQEQA